MAKRLSEANDVVVLENLALANMTASARGKSSTEDYEMDDPPGIAHVIEHG